MSSKRLEELNHPFKGGPSDSLSRMRLRYLKTELKENPSPNLRYIRQGVRQFLPHLQDTIASLPKNSILIVMPSTSQVNKIPVFLAAEFKKIRPDLRLVNLKEKSIKVAHRTPSKIKGNYLGKSVDHRQFAFDDKFVASASQFNERPTYILDDSISTGDSAVTLQRQLLREGIQTKGIVTAVANEKYHARVSDLRRTFDKLAPHLPNGYSQEELKQDMFTTFAGFPRRKIANFEIAFSTGELKKQKDVAFTYIQKTAQHMREHRLSPSHVLHHQKLLSEKLDIKPTIKQARGPRL